MSSLSNLGGGGRKQCGICSESLCWHAPRGFCGTCVREEDCMASPLQGAQPSPWPTGSLQDGVAGAWPMRGLSFSQLGTASCLPGAVWGFLWGTALTCVLSAVSQLFPAAGCLLHSPERWVCGYLRNCFFSSYYCCAH